MTLDPGQVLGPYEILSPAGAGGMGEVYKAKDTRLDRTVAIKVLPHRTAQNADLRARFEREAKAISSLNHPNICTLHDIGHENDIDYLVMEYIEGESLSERLKRGAMDLEESLRIALQVAEALDSAHRKGLVHRDLKPGNVMLTKEGAKLLDFGLAKLQVAGGVVDGVSGITQSTPLTGAGTIIGTIQYMSPEQLEGSEADHRSDIFAFGAVLYEMISGQRPFEGKSQASVIAAIIERQPTPLSSVSPMSPPGLDRLVKKCLEKDPDDRWQSARDLADEIRWLMTGSQAGIPAPVSKRRRVRSRLAWSLVAVFVLSTITLGLRWLMQPEPDLRVRRFEIMPKESILRISWPQISPDGTMLAFLGRDSGGPQQIYLRPMNSLESNPLPGTEDAGRPFWSPDSKWLAFFVGQGQLKKVPVTGGPAQLLGVTERGADGSWGKDDIILFDGARGDSIRAFSASGGVERGMTNFDSESPGRFHAWPECLPDGEHFLYLELPDTAAASSGYRLMVSSNTSRKTKFICLVDSRVSYTKSGHILYCRNSTLVAQPFDLESLETTGEPVPLAQDIPANQGTGGANFSVSQEGTLVYQQTDFSSNSAIFLMDRQGEVLDTIGEPAQYGDIRLSPDGRYIAYGLSAIGSAQSDIWIYDQRRDVSTRLTFDDGEEINPVWTPDGAAVAYSQGKIPAVTSFIRAANGTEQPRPLFGTDSAALIHFDFADNNRTISASTITTDGVDLIAIERDADWSSHRVLAETEFNEFHGEFSPDGRFIAYVSEESGNNEVYLLRIEGKTDRWQVSFGGGFQPRWNKDGSELYYINNGRMMAVDVQLGETVEVGRPAQLFRFTPPDRIFRLSDFDVYPDGQKFIVNSQLVASDRKAFVVVQDWWVELEPKR